MPRKHTNFFTGSSLVHVFDASPSVGSMAPSQDRDTSYATNNEDAGNLYMNEEETHRL